MNITETSHAGGFLISEANGHFSRENGILKDGQNLKAGAILGAFLAVGTLTAVGSPVGNGAITVGATIGPDTVPGTYKLVCVAAASNSGTFNLYAPNGTLVRQITVGGGATPSDHLSITIADGLVDFAVNDTWTVAVGISGYVALTPAGTNGNQTAVGILYAGVDASAGDRPCVVIRRDAEVNYHELIWPVGMSDGQKTAANDDLAARGIILR